MDEHGDYKADALTIATEAIDKHLTEREQVR
jgi:hypothetical protein